MIKYILAFLLLTATYGTGSIDNPTRQALLSQNNIIRESIGKSALKLNDDLNKEAQRHAAWMAKNNSLVHSNWKTRGHFSNFPIKNNDRELMYIQENIVSATTNPFGAWCDCYPSLIEGQWRKPHYETLTGDYNVCGFGLAYSIDGTPYWCAVYAKLPLDRNRVIE